MSAVDDDAEPSISPADAARVAGYAALAVGTPLVLRSLGKAVPAAVDRDHHETDLLVIGGGGAGIFAALRGRQEGLRVTLVDKGTVGCSGLSPWASGVQMFDPASGDRAAWHDAISHVGEQVNNRHWLDLYLDQSKVMFDRLLAMGVLTGNIVERGRILRGRLLDAGVELVERVMVTSLLRSATGEVGGAAGFHYDDSHSRCRAVLVSARAVVLCTGPATFKAPGFPAWGQTGDGDALSYRAGARISGKEFADSHMTFARHPADVWGGWGASQDRFVGGEGRPSRDNPFALDLERFFQAADGITDTVGTGGPPGTYGSPGGPVDPRVRGGAPPPPPPPPSAALGSPPRLRLDLDVLGTRMVGGATNGMAPHKAEGVFCADVTGAAEGVPGLFAAGDALSSMLLGATYSMGGTSYLGSCQQGDHVAGFAVAHARRAGRLRTNEPCVAAALEHLWAPARRGGSFSPQWVAGVLRNAMMPYYVLYVKSGERMAAALAMVESLRDRCVPSMRARDGHELRLAHETANMVLNAEMKLRAGLFRTESRGTHYREDYPARDDDAWLAWVTLHEVDGRMCPERRAITVAAGREREPYRVRYPRPFPGEDEFLAHRQGRA